jgi:phenylacetate-CoA ligase
MSGEPDPLARLSRLFDLILPANAFYARKFGTPELRTWADFTALPFTTKSELLGGANRTLPLDRYTRMHQTSGTTTGQPLRVYDTPESWQSLCDCWHPGFADLGITASDRLYFPFSFGPFLGFWTAFEAATRAGFFTLPGGGQNTSARLRCLLDHGITVVFCTPTYGLHLAEVAAKEGIDLAASAVTKLVVAGEPGGSIAGLRAQLEAAWGARVLDHYGLTEVGPMAFEHATAPGSMAVLESHFVAEMIDENADGVGELVVTNLHRTACPVVRYRTGDLVRLQGNRLVGGILGRTDDMLHVRGNNVYPTAIEAIVRRFPEVAEFRLIVEETGPMADLRLELEPHSFAAGDLAPRVQRTIREELLFRVEVTTCPAGSLPRFELKARRLVRNRRANPPAAD